MGAGLSTIRWTPFGPVPDSRHHKHHGTHHGTDSWLGDEYPPHLQHLPPGHLRGRSASLPHSYHSSHSNTGGHDSSHHSHEFEEEEDNVFHPTSSGVLMGANAPPLYDACLIGRWEEVLEICNYGRDNSGGTGSGGSGGDAGHAAVANHDSNEGSGADVGLGGLGATGASGASGASGSSGASNADAGDGSNTTEPTVGCSSSGDEDGWSSTFRPAPIPTSVTHQTHQPDPSSDPNHPSNQLLYTDRRLNTPLHLACRRQPPPAVIRALLRHSPPDARTSPLSRKTADGLTPLHFAAYCGAGVEVVGMLVDRMRSDAAVRRAMRLSGHFEEGGMNSLNHLNLSTTMTTMGNSMGDAPHAPLGSSHASHSPHTPHTSQPTLPPTRLLDRRQRTPLHCAIAGFRTPTRPSIVRKLLSVDPTSSTLGDERGRTPFSLLFDDYAEEVMEALEEDVTSEMARTMVGEAVGKENGKKGRVGTKDQGSSDGKDGKDGKEVKGGELSECWEILKLLLQAAFQGSVMEEEDEMDLMEDTFLGAGVTGSGRIGEEDLNDEVEEKKDGLPFPQDRSSHHHGQKPKEINVLDIYDQHHFSMVHAAAGVWECPPPLAKLVLKVMCGTCSKRSNSGTVKTEHADSSLEDRFEDISLGKDDGNHVIHAASNNPANEGEPSSDWNPNIVSIEREKVSHDEYTSFEASGDGGDNCDSSILQQPDEETMRLPLHIAVCARPRERSGYSARIRYWLSSTEATGSLNSLGPVLPSVGKRSKSFTSGSGLANDEKWSTTNSISGGGRVYNPRFGRSPSSDGVAAFSSDAQRRSSFHALNSSFSSVGNLSRRESFREPFLRHSIIRDILELYPHAASMVDDRTGKLPVVLAIESGKSWEMGVRPLLEAYSEPFRVGTVGLEQEDEESAAHRKAVGSALLSALSGPEAYVREEATRTAGQLAKWGGVWGMEGGLDGIVSEWLTMIVNQGGVGVGTVGKVVGGPGAPMPGDWVRTQSSLLNGIADIVSHSIPGSISDRVARSCLDTGRECLFSKDAHVREAAARALGAALDSVGDSDDAATVMREVVLNIAHEDGSVTSASTGRGREDVISKHGKLLACTAILSIKWGSNLLATKEIRDGVVYMVRRRVKDKNTVVRSTAYQAIGPVLGKSPPPTDPKTAETTTTMALKEMRSDILKGTRATEQVEVQLALARGLIAASRMHPGLFLCKSGMPIMDAALMLAMSTSTIRPNVQKAFQVFLWVALKMGKEEEPLVCGGAAREEDTTSGRVGPMLEKYIELAEGENGRIMMNFVTQTLAKIDDVDETF